MNGEIFGELNETTGLELVFGHGRIEFVEGLLLGSGAVGFSLFIHEEDRPLGFNEVDWERKTDAGFDARLIFKNAESIDVMISALNECRKQLAENGGADE